MSKEKGKKKQQKDKSTIPPVNLILPENMSTDDMKTLIVDSLLAYDQAKTDLDKKTEEIELQRRRELVGYKDYSNRKLIPRVFLTFLNQITVLFKVLFMPKSKIKGDYATTGLLKFAVSVLFSAAKWILWVVAVSLILSYPLSLIVPKSPVVDLTTYPTYIGFGLLAFLFAQLFRVASIEVDKMKDHNYIVDLFAAVAAVVAIVISIVLR